MHSGTVIRRLAKRTTRIPKQFRLLHKDDAILETKTRSQEVR